MSAYNPNDNRPAKGGADVQAILAQATETLIESPAHGIVVFLIHDSGIRCMARGVINPAHLARTFGQFIADATGGCLNPLDLAEEVALGARESLANSTPQGNG